MKSVNYPASQIVEDGDYTIFTDKSGETRAVYSGKAYSGDGSGSTVDISEFARHELSKDGITAPDGTELQDTRMVAAFGFDEAAIGGNLFTSIAYGGGVFVMTSAGRIYYGTEVAALNEISVPYALNEVRYNSTRAEFWTVGNGVIGYSPDGASWTWIESAGNWTGVAFVWNNVVTISSDSACLFEDEDDTPTLVGVFAFTYSGYKSIDLLDSDDDSGEATFALAGDGIAGTLEFSSDGGYVSLNEPTIYPGITFNKIRTLSDGSVVAVGKNSDGNAVYAKGTQPGNVIPILSSTTDWTLASSAGWTGVGTRTFGTYHGYACMRTAATYSGVYRLYSAAPIFPIGTTAYVSVDVYAESAGTINVGSESASGRVKAITTVGEWHTVSMQMTPTAASSFIVYNASTAVIYFKNVRVSYMETGTSIDIATNSVVAGELSDLVSIDSFFDDAAVVSVGTRNEGGLVASGLYEPYWATSAEYFDIPPRAFTAVTLGGAYNSDFYYVYAVTEDGAIYRTIFNTEDGGINWTQVTEPIITDAGLFAYDYNTEYISDIGTERMNNDAMSYDIVPGQFATLSFYSESTESKTVTATLNGTTVDTRTTSARSFQYWLDTSDLEAQEGDTLVLAVGGYSVTYTFADPCSYRYVLYYVNKYGGVDSLLIKGRVTESLSNSPYTINGFYDRSRPGNFQRRTIQNTATRSWEFNTAYMTVEESEKIDHLTLSPKVWMQDLDSGLMYAALISDSSVEVKRGKLSERRYAITVSQSQDIIRR